LASHPSCRSRQSSQTLGNLDHTYLSGDGAGFTDPSAFTIFLGAITFALVRDEELVVYSGEVAIERAGQLIDNLSSGDISVRWL
jgi:hypothetical protein